MKLIVTELTDRHDCETCGSSYATGFVVTSDNKVLVELRPAAHCIDGSDYDAFDLLRHILRVLGHEIEFEALVGLIDNTDPSGS